MESGYADGMGNNSIRFANLWSWTWLYFYVAIAETGSFNPFQLKVMFVFNDVKLKWSAHLLYSSRWLSEYNSRNATAIQKQKRGLCDSLYSSSFYQVLCWHFFIEMDFASNSKDLFDSMEEIKPSTLPTLHKNRNQGIGLIVNASMIWSCFLRNQNK